MKCAEVALFLDTAICDTFEFQGTARTISIVRHGGVVTETSGPVGPTAGSGNTPGRRGISLGAVCRGMGER